MRHIRLRRVLLPIPVPVTYARKSCYNIAAMSCSECVHTSLIAQREFQRMEEHKNKTLLLVEDEVIISLAESSVLAEHGYNVLNAYSGEHAVQMADEHRC